MPSWGEILAELQQTLSTPGAAPDFDGVRRKYLAQLYALTDRPVILYSTAWFDKSGPAASITLGDMQGMMEVCRDLPGPSLDIILHSPGGSAEATASIVSYLRTKFTDIRTFVPVAAMSAATMWALASNRVVMGKHSQLGPIDPQLVTSIGQLPARGIIEQFERAKRECSADPSLLGAWYPILQQYGPALLDQCEKAEQLARRLVEQWLRDYMLHEAEDRDTRAASIAEFFADYTIHQSHSLGIRRDEARTEGVVIDDLEADQELQDAVLSVHHATMHTFNGPAIKIVENHLGRAYAQLQHVQAIQIPALQIPQAPAAIVPLQP